jgi:hypothetical protein
MQRIEKSSRGRVSIIVKDWPEQFGEGSLGWRHSERLAEFWIAWWRVKIVLNVGCRWN